MIKAIDLSLLFWCTLIHFKVSLRTFLQGVSTLTNGFPEHELIIEKIAREIGFVHISLSSQLLPMIKLTSRGSSATADAYLTPVVQRYIEGFRSGFEGGLQPGDSRCEFMQSDGGLVNFEKYS